MNRSHLFASVMLLAAGCGLPPETIGESGEALTRSMILRAGGECGPSGKGMQRCTICYYVHYDGKQVGVCDVWYCEDGVAECVYHPNASFDPDRKNVWLEGEAGTLVAPMQKVIGAGASGGAAASAPANVSGTGSVSWTFDLAEAGTFYPWARVSAPSAAANSFAIQIDRGPAVSFDLPVGGAFFWTQVQRLGDTSRSRFNLAAGTHVVRILSAEHGASLDRLLLTGDAAFVPIATTIEAEQAARVAPMTSGTTSSIPQTGYLWVPNGAGSGGSADLQTPVPHTGSYAIWGRVNAPSVTDNSFFLSADFGPHAQWETPVTSTSGWTWAQVTNTGADGVHLFELHDQYSFVRIDAREDGTKLDKIIVTNDPGFVPVDPPQAISTGGTTY